MAPCSASSVKWRRVALKAQAPRRETQASDMNDVTISILIVGAVILIALVVVYFGLVRRRRDS